MNDHTSDQVGAAIAEAQAPCKTAIHADTQELLRQLRFAAEVFHPAGEAANLIERLTNNPQHEPAREHGDGQSAWLLEWPATRQMPVRYWHPTEGHVIDPNDALRFARREDAEAMSKRDHLIDARPVEHKWLEANHAR